VKKNTNLPPRMIDNGGATRLQFRNAKLAITCFDSLAAPKVWSFASGGRRLRIVVQST
jgi:hypothetical protein